MYIPKWYEWLLLSKKIYHLLRLFYLFFCPVWVSGLLLTELTTVGERTGVGMLKFVLVKSNILIISIYSDHSLYSLVQSQLDFIWPYSLFQQIIPTPFCM